MASQPFHSCLALFLSLLSAHHSWTFSPRNMSVLICTCTIYHPSCCVCVCVYTCCGSAEDEQHCVQLLLHRTAVRASSSGGVVRMLYQVRFSVCCYNLSCRAAQGAGLQVPARYGGLLEVSVWMWRRVSLLSQSKILERDNAVELLCMQGATPQHYDMRL